LDVRTNGSKNGFGLMFIWKNRCAIIGTDTRMLTNWKKYYGFNEKDSDLIEEELIGILKVKKGQIIIKNIQENLPILITLNMNYRG
jgi:hypothetical protein